MSRDDDSRVGIPFQELAGRLWPGGHVRVTGKAQAPGVPGLDHAAPVQDASVLEVDDDVVERVGGAREMDLHRLGADLEVQALGQRIEPVGGGELLAEQGVPVFLVLAPLVVGQDLLHGLVPALGDEFGGQIRAIAGDALAIR
jgi:hypothetical protein